MGSEMCIRDSLWIELFPKGHPFHDEVIGSMEDLSNITLAQVKTYFSSFYGPSNATLAVVGDFDRESARAIVAEYFGGLPATTVPAPGPVSPGAVTKEMVIQHRETYGRSPRLHMAWHVPAKYAADHAAGEMTAMLLGGLEASRLVMGIPDAVWSFAYQESLLAGSVFHLLAEPRSGVALDALHRKVENTLDILRQHPPSEAQMDHALRRLLRERLLALEDSLLKAQLLVDILASNNLQGDPMTFEKNRLAKVTPADVQRFASTHLTADRRVVVYSTPGSNR